MTGSLLEFLAGALTFAYLIAGLFFLRFRRKTGDRLFFFFALAFWLFAANQIVVFLLDGMSEVSGSAYVLRVAGFILILIGIIDRNTRLARRK
jgi:hypothetical protein